MLTEIKIMLGMVDDKEENNVSDNNYDSFLDDVKSSHNKTGPNMDDHNVLSNIAKKLRAKSPCDIDKVEEHQDPRSEGFVEKIRRMLKER